MLFGYTEDEIRKILGDKYKDKYRPFMSWIIKDSPYEKIFFELFNCSFEEFANAIIEKQYSQSQKDQMKMTREEARKIVFDKCKFLEGREAGYLVEVLEALGLIKFDEPKIDKKLHAAITMARISTDSPENQTDFINCLAGAGYKIVKADA